MNEYEQNLYDHIIWEKLGELWKSPEYKALSQEQEALQKELEDQITGAQKRLFRRHGEISIQMTSLEMELVFQETLSMDRTLFHNRTE